MRESVCDEDSRVGNSGRESDVLIQKGVGTEGTY